jgi:hypothetical protein
MKTDTYEYTVAEHWLPAIINGDYTGLTDGEEIELNNWLDANQEAGAHWDTDGYISFDKDEIGGLMADCVSLIQHVNFRG